MYRKGWKPGRWSAICDRCGFRYHSDAILKEWTGLMVCNPCHDSRHPQDFIRVRSEHVVPPWTRPEPIDIFLPDSFSDLYLDTDFLYLDSDALGLD